MEIKNKYGYVRVSSKTQESNSSIESQKQQLIQNGIEEAVKAYAENDAYRLKFYHFAGEVDIAVFNRLQAEHTEYLKELDELDNS